MAIKDLTIVKKHLFICNGNSCLKAGAGESTKALRSCIAALELNPQIHTTRTLCNGRCEEAPVVIVMPDNIWYKGIVADMAQGFIENHIMADIVMDTHVLFEYTGSENRGKDSMDES